MNRTHITMTFTGVVLVLTLSSLSVLRTTIKKVASPQKDPCQIPTGPQRQMLRPSLVADSGGNAKRAIDGPQAAHASILRTTYFAYNPLPQAIREIIGRDRASDYLHRSRAVNLLQRPLREHEMQALFEFLHRPPEQDILPLKEVYALKNDLMDMLVAQPTLHRKLGQHLLAITTDKHQNRVIRDYCLQHLVPYYERKWRSEETRALDPEQEQIDETLARLARDHSSPLAGTALLCWVQLAEQYEHLDLRAVHEASVAIAMNQQANRSSRLTALIVAYDL